MVFETKRIISADDCNAMSIIGQRCFLSDDIYHLECNVLNNRMESFGTIPNEIKNGKFKSGCFTGKYAYPITETCRMMTNGEFVDFLGIKGREYKDSEGIKTHFTYEHEAYKNECIPDEILVRSNGGEWHKPTVKIEYYA